MDKISENVSSSMNNTNMESHQEPESYILEMRPCDRGEQEIGKREPRSSHFSKKPPLARMKSMRFRKNMRKKREDLAEKQTKPFCCSKTVVRYPWLVIAVASLLFLISTALILWLGLFKYSNV